MAEFVIVRTIPEQIAEHLRQEIISGSLTEGEPLREKEIADRFGVSRGPIREVFRQLTQQGLLELEPNKGVRVADSPSPEVRSLIVELRRKVETFIISNCFDQISEKDIQTWELILEEIKDACQSGAKVALTNLDIRLHEAIIQACDDQGLFTIWQTITLRMSMRYQRHGDLMESYYEHKRIIDAIRAGDKAEAIAALNANLR
jgi:DNA-binding GntR family transcriptional regulator